MVPRFEKRVKAYAIEISAVTVVLLIAAMGLGNDLLTIILVAATYLFVSIIPIIASKGQSYGKRIQKIKIVKMDGTEASPLILVLREIFKTVASAGTLGLYMIAAYFAMTETHVSRTIHDYIFKTKVIDLEKAKKPYKHEDHFLGKSESMKNRGL